jgi:hypothetical protein
MNKSEWGNLRADPGKILGVADPGLVHFPKWVNAHTARKVIIHRDARDIAKSLGPGISAHDWNLNRFAGMHVTFDDLFNNPAPIYEYLLLKPFDKERHELLKSLQTNTMLDKIAIDPLVLERYLKDVKEGRG